MSESGKVSLPGMTPERLEEIKLRLTEKQARIGWLENSEVELMEALAALEESQRQLIITKEASEFKAGALHIVTEERNTLRKSLEESGQQSAKWEKAFDNADRQYLKQEKAAADLRHELAEAQQTTSKLELYVKSLEFSRDEAQKTAHDIEREKGLELFEAQQTIARIQDERFQFEKSTADALSEVWRLERELRWYADEINWNQGDWEGGIFYTLADRDGGKRAQAALGKKEGTDTNG